MKTIFEYFKASVIASYYETMPNDEQTFFLEYYFDNDKQYGLDLSWIKGAGSTPTLLKPSNFDADPTFRDLEGFEVEGTKMPLFREGYLLKEQDRRDIMDLIAAGNGKALELILNKVYRQIQDLLLSAAVTREHLRAQLFTTGKIAINFNGVAYDYDYNLLDEQKVTPTVKWNVVATADPFTDLEDWANDAQTRTGVRPTQVVMNSNTFNLIKKADSVVAVFKDYQLGVPTNARIKNYIRDELKLEVILYDKQYKKVKGAVAQKYIPDNVVVLTPDITLGTTMFGVTTEEDALNREPDVNVAVVDTGVAITTEVVKKIPFKLEIVASQIVLPTFEQGDKIVIATVV